MSGLGSGPGLRFELIFASKLLFVLIYLQIKIVFIIIGPFTFNFMLDMADFDLICFQRLNST